MPTTMIPRQQREARRPRRSREMSTNSAKAERSLAKTEWSIFKPDKKELHQMLDEKLSEGDIELSPSDLAAAHELLDRELQD
jgi:hypothetical protein